MDEKHQINPGNTPHLEANVAGGNQASPQIKPPANAPEPLRMSGLTIGRRLLLGGAGSIIIIFLMVGIAFYLVTTIAERFDKVINDARVEEKALDVIERAIATILSETREYALLGEAETLEEIDEAAAALEQAQTSYLKTERADEAEEEEELEVLDQLETAATDIQSASAAIISLVDRDAAEEELEEALEEGLEEAETTFETAMAKARAVSDEEVAETAEATAGTIRGLAFFIIVFPIVAVLLAGGISYGLWRSIARRVEDLAGTAQAITAGDLEQQARVDSSDELGVMATAFNRMTAQLRAQIDSAQVQSQRLELIASLSERLTAILDFNELLPELVNQVQQSFNYYHTHIYIIDDERQNLVVAAGAGEAGARMKAEGYSVPLATPTSLVARAARTRTVVSVDNVREADDWLPNPLLPDTYSEIAIPIILEGEVVGVLDVQDDEVAGLGEDDASLLRSLVNQVVVAIRNARQFEQVKNALAEAQALQAQYLEQAWDKSNLSRFTSAQAEVRFAGAASSGQEAELGPVLTAPIEFRQITIGHLELEDANPQRVWSEDELALVNAVVDQVAQTAENLRLFEETRERAGREATIREITDKLRAAPNLNALLEIASRELGQRLGVPQTVLELGIEAQKGNNGQ